MYVCVRECMSIHVCVVSVLCLCDCVCLRMCLYVVACLCVCLCIHVCLFVCVKQCEAQGQPQPVISPQPTSNHGCPKIEVFLPQLLPQLSGDGERRCLMSPHCELSEYVNDTIKDWIKH